MTALIAPLLPIASSAQSPGAYDGPTTLRSETRTHFDPAAFSFVVPSGWRELTGVSAPQGFDGIRFALGKDGTPCTIAYAFVSRDRPYVEERYLGFPDRMEVGVDEDVFSRWILLGLDIAKFQPELAQEPWRMPAAINVADYEWGASWDRRVLHRFVLFDRTRTTGLPQHCDADFRALLGTLRFSAPPARLDSSSQGRLFLRGTTDGDGVLFLEGRDGLPRIAHRLQIAYAPRAWSPTAYRNEFYFLDAHGLWRLHLGTANPKRLEGPGVREGETINDYFFYQGRIFYLIGKPCRNYLEECNSRLVEHGFDDAPPVELATGVAARTFLGFDADENTLYFSYIDGDVGEHVFSIFRYRFSSRRIEIVSGPHAWTNDVSAYQAQQTRFRSQVDLADHVRLDGNLLLPADGQIRTLGAIQIRFIR